ncbi:HNH endonuclease family protein [Aquihabitans sp. G128]|uniref:HNH endonuclease family protein n=1 Tax=Aquihabitans sp. G128 TaxID=2849779 RepID=UPI001C245A4A|nr:HNH endonuclease family protein [Aquihabitans sp. G128]QXC60787.1 HNH endonuclease family protein [Aquihabitans sp. G128]
MSRGSRRWPRSARSVVGGLLAVLAVLVVVQLAGGSDDQSAAPGTTTSVTGAPSTAPGPPTSVGSATAGAVSTTTVSIVDPSSTTTTLVEGGEARAMVDRLVVAVPAADLAPYRRAAFGDDWSYDPATKCNTRERVLIEESLVPPVVDAQCRSTGGRWRSVYDGVVVTEVAKLQIDHLIPLADAWRSGASAWTDERRLAFANDLDDPDTLVAVTASTNESKSDRTPDEWLPPDRTAWCTYAEDWVDVKARWGLTVTLAEKATLVQVLAGC